MERPGPSRLESEALFRTRAVDPLLTISRPSPGFATGCHRLWTIGDDGHVVASRGNYDQYEYARQLEHGTAET
jgi:hypothetical protein